LSRRVTSHNTQRDAMWCRGSRTKDDKNVRVMDKVVLVHHTAPICDPVRGNRATDHIKVRNRRKYESFR
jgi:hypothetical protein